MRISTVARVLRRSKSARMGVFCIGLFLLTAVSGPVQGDVWLSYHYCGDSTCDSCRDWGSGGGFCIIQQNAVAACLKGDETDMCRIVGSNPKCSGTNYTGGSCSNQAGGTPDGTNCALTVTKCSP